MAVAAFFRVWVYWAALPTLKPEQLILVLLVVIADLDY